MPSPYIVSAHHRFERDGLLTTRSFPGDVVILFEDGSRVEFRHAFASLEGIESDIWAVYTEHCGYHAFRESAVREIQGDTE